MAQSCSIEEGHTLDGSEQAPTPGPRLASPGVIPLAKYMPGLSLSRVCRRHCIHYVPLAVQLRLSSDGEAALRRRLDAIGGVLSIGREEPLYYEKVVCTYTAS